MPNFNELNVTNSTIIDWEGKEYKTIQDAYVDDYDNFGNLLYKAHAVDENNKEYLIIWHQKEGFEYENSDLSEACDWDNPESVEKLGE